MVLYKLFQLLQIQGNASNFDANHALGPRVPDVQSFGQVSLLDAIITELLAKKNTTHFRMKDTIFGVLKNIKLFSYNCQISTSDTRPVDGQSSDFSAGVCVGTYE